MHDDVVAGLEPAAFWRHFVALSHIPRMSKHEAAAAAYVVDTARARGAEASTDEAGNVLVKVRATKGREAAPPVCVQCHLDMVGVAADGVSHDFLRHGLTLERRGDWLSARGTSLGADNGVGVAACLALLEGDGPHGPLEVLFTVDEEQGASGARAVTPSTFSARTLVNLDAEEDGFLCVGCAGSRRTTMTFSAALVPRPRTTLPMRLVVDGLVGGHSGTDIHRRRGNAAKILAWTLWTMGGSADIALSTVAAGGPLNAIPRQAEAVIHVTKDVVRYLEDVAVEVRDVVRRRLASEDPDVDVRLVPAVDESGAVITSNDVARLASLMTALPHGALATGGDGLGVVETSTNLARVASTDTDVVIHQTTRSLVPEAGAEVVAAIEAVARLAGVRSETTGGGGAWSSRRDGRLVGTATALWQRRYGTVPRVAPVHAGLECLAFATAIPDLDMVAFGPTILDAHTPSERLQVHTVPRFVDFLAALLDELSHS